MNKIDLAELRFMKHDGYSFHISMRNYENLNYEIIGYYYDRLGYLQTIHRDSVHGEAIKRHIEKS